MTTMKYEGVDYNVVYIDPSAETNGDGTTYSTAMNAFPSSYTDKTVYLIRRTEETSKLSMPKSGNTGLQYVMFLGMPREDQQLYTLLNDAGVKEAWKDETAKYANLLMNSDAYTDKDSTTNVVYYEESNRVFIALNCYFFRDNDGASASSRDYVNHMIYISSGATRFEGCKFGYTQYDLDNDDYLANNTDIDQNTSKYPQLKAKRYIYVKGNECIFNNCIVNTVDSINSIYGQTTPDNINLSRWSINISSTNCYVSKCTFNKYSISIYSSYNPYFSSVCLYSTNTYVEDCKINVINPCLNLRTLEIANGAGKVKVHNININTKGFKNYDVKTFSRKIDTNTNNEILFITSQNLYGDYGFIQKVNIDNIKADFSKGSVKLYTAPVLDIRGLPYWDHGNPSSYIKNIDIKFAKEDGVYNNYGSVVYISSLDSKLDFYATNNWPSNDLRMSSEYSQNIGKSYLIENINIEAPYCTGDVLKLKGVAAKNVTLNGGVYLKAATLEATKIYNNIGSRRAISIDANSYLRCHEYEVNTNNKDYLYTGNKQISLTYGDPISIYVDRTNAILFDNTFNSTANSSARYCSWMCPNYIQNGQFYGRNESVFAKTWNVVRTGSTAQASIRFSNNGNTDSNWLVIGDEPYKGFVVKPTATGAKKLTAYFALKNIADNDIPLVSRDFVLDVRVPELDADGNVSYNHVYSSEYIMQEDNSTWSNDSDLKTYKFELPIEIKDLTNDIEVAVSYRHYSALGVLYFDPDIKLTDIA